MLRSHAIGFICLKVTKTCSFLTEFASEATKTLSFLKGIGGRSAAGAADLHANCVLQRQFAEDSAAVVMRNFEMLGVPMVMKQTLSSGNKEMVRFDLFQSEATALAKGTFSTMKLGAAPPGDKVLRRQDLVRLQMGVTGLLRRSYT